MGGRRARLLSHNHVLRLRGQPRALPLGVTVPPNSRAADGAALHQSPGPKALEYFCLSASVSATSTQPFYFLGPVSYVNHRGDKPASFTWRLPKPMPEALFEARSVAAA